MQRSVSSLNFFIFEQIFGRVYNKYDSLLFKTSLKKITDKKKEFSSDFKNQYL